MTNTAKVFATEFPDFPAADFPALPPGFVDSSWRNDSCPSIKNESIGLLVFIEYADKAMRSEGTTDSPRYAVGTLDKSGSLIGEESILNTDDWDCVLGLINALTPSAKPMTNAEGLAHLKKLADAARPIRDFPDPPHERDGEDDYGSERQIEAQNAFFEAIEKIMPAPEFQKLEDYCFKADVNGMVDEAMRMINAQIGPLSPEGEFGKPDSILMAAVKADDLDAALGGIMRALGITHGDLAGQLFSDDDRRAWAAAGASNHRCEELARWLKQEIYYAAPAMASKPMRGSVAATIGPNEKILSNTEHWSVARYPGDTVKIVHMARGDERGAIRIQDYGATMRPGTGRYKVASFLPGVIEQSPGDTPKIWPERHNYCATKELADTVFWIFIRAALNDGWL